MTHLGRVPAGLAEAVKLPWLSDVHDLALGRARHSTVQADGVSIW